MKVNDFLKPLIPDLFSFAFAMIPDDLQAQQIVIDSIHGLAAQMTTDEKKIMEMAQADVSLAPEEIVKQIYKSLLKNAFTIGHKRTGQLPSLDLGQIKKRQTTFYRCQASERAILFLRYHTKFNIDDIADIVSVDRPMVIASLNQARQKVMRESTFKAAGSSI